MSHFKQKLKNDAKKCWFLVEKFLVTRRCRLGTHQRLWKRREFESSKCQGLISSYLSHHRLGSTNRLGRRSVSVRSGWKFRSLDPLKGLYFARILFEKSIGKVTAALMGVKVRMRHIVTDEYVTQIVCDTIVLSIRYWWLEICYQHLKVVANIPHHHWCAKLLFRVSPGHVWNKTQF